jgi:hypothetical protein
MALSNNSVIYHNINDLWPHQMADTFLTQLLKRYAYEILGAIGADCIFIRQLVRTVGLEPKRFRCRLFGQCSYLSSWK